METYSSGQTVHYHGRDLTPYVLTSSDYAVMLNGDGAECPLPNCVADIAQNYATAESMILEGYIGVAVAAEDQAALDYQRALYRDCWSVPAAAIETEGN